MVAGAFLGAAPGRWTRVSGEGYEVVTDAGAAAAERVGNRVARMRELLGAPVKLLPLRVVLTGSQSLFASLRPAIGVAGFYQSSANEDWVVVRWGREDSERAVSHELVHAFMEHNGPRRPLWLEEGLAEFYSTARLTDREWIIGEPIPSHARLLSGAGWLEAGRFFGITPDSPLRDESTRSGIFYAQSWAVVHFLLTSPQVRARSPEFFSLLADGKGIASAAQTALRLTPEQLVVAARNATRSGRFPVATIAPRIVSPEQSKAEALTESDAADLLARLAMAAGHPEVAAGSKTSAELRGLQALTRNDRSEAERLFREAIAEKSAGPVAYFELAMLLRDARREPDEARRLLRETLRLNPNHAEAHFILGLIAAAAGDREEAIGQYQNAARILPRQATFWHALALELERAGRTAEASHAAQRCLMAARNKTEREMAEGLDHLVHSTNEPGFTRKPDVTTPESWKGLQGDRSAEGVLVHLDCAADPPLARIQTGKDELKLRLARPDQIRITGTGAVRHTLACGEQRLPVRIRYQSGSNELAAIEFR